MKGIRSKCRSQLERLVAKAGLKAHWNQILRRYAMRSSLLENIPRQGCKIAQVVGTPRSGSTLLSTMLDAHSKVVCLIEPFLAWLKHGKFEYDWGQTVLQRFAERRPHRLLSHLCQNTDLSVVAFKETFRTQSHPTFPTQFFLQKNSNQGGVDQTIAIIRDPRDTWSSVIHRHSHFKGDSATLGELLHAWNELCKWTQQKGIPFVRYEDLVADRRSSERVLNVLGLPMQQGVLNPKGTPGYGDARAQAGGAISDASIGRYKETLSSPVTVFIEAHCSTHMQHLGYQ